VNVADEVAAVLEAAEPSALFVTELAARLPDRELTEIVAALATSPRFLVVDNPSPDRHLQGDLRVAAVETEQQSAVAAAADVWSGWLRDFCLHHRCS
jgi:hypothetical protein